MVSAELQHRNSGVYLCTEVRGHLGHMGLAGEQWQSATRTCCGEGRSLVHLKKKLSDCLVEESKGNYLEGSEIEKREDLGRCPVVQ